MNFDDFQMPQDIYVHTIPFTDMINISYGNYDMYIKGIMSLEPGAQFNFLTKRENMGNKYMIIVTDTQEPPKIDNLVNPLSPHVFACVFGLMTSMTTTSHRNMAEVWYLGTNKLNTKTYNKSTNSKKMWGPINLKKTKNTKGKLRWVKVGKDLNDTNYLNETNYIGENIQGRANPFATLALYHFCKLAISKNINKVTQANLPCAHPFHDHYNQETSPAIHLIYTALGFLPSIDGYKLTNFTMEKLYKKYDEHVQSLKTTL